MTADPSSAGLYAGSGTRLGDRLFQEIAVLIDDGAFGDGRLPAESELATRFGVSRPVIREALSRLRAMGVIVSRKGSGSYVRKLAPAATPPAVGFGPISSLSQVSKCYDFRMSIEGDAAYYAAQHRTEATLRPMRESLERMESAIAQRAMSKGADVEFHFAVARASGNEFFEAVMEAMRTPLEFAVNLARTLTLTRPLEHLLVVQAEHVALLDAIEAGDSDRARLAMRTHIANARSRIFDGPGKVSARADDED